MKKSPIPSHFAVAFNPQIEGAEQEARSVVDFLQSHGIDHPLLASLFDKKLKEEIDQRHIDILITLGGDGSMLRASHLCAQAGTSILGINMGAFGFLMELQKEDWRKYLPDLLEGKFRHEERMLLQANLFNGKTLKGSWEVVNEVVVCRGQLVKPIRLHARVNNYPMASYVADGLIAATPTGSTAYALAAGGAIMPPELRNILIVPVAPHISLDRAIILSEGASVTITVNTSHQAVLSVDGHDPVAMSNEDYVKVEASQRNVTFIRFHDPGYFYKNLSHYMEKNPSTSVK